MSKILFSWNFHFFLLFSMTFGSQPRKFGWDSWFSREISLFFELAKFENHRKKQEKMKISRKKLFSQSRTCIRWCLPNMKSRGPLSFDISRKNFCHISKNLDFWGLNTFWWVFLWNLSRFPGFSKISENIKFWNQDFSKTTERILKILDDYERWDLALSRKPS